MEPDQAHTVYTHVEGSSTILIGEERPRPMEREYLLLIFEDDVNYHTRGLPDGWRAAFRERRRTADPSKVDAAALAKAASATGPPVQVQGTPAPGIPDLLVSGEPRRATTEAVMARAARRTYHPKVISH